MNNGHSIGNVAHSVGIAGPLRSDGNLLVGISSRIDDTVDYYLSAVSSESQILASDTVVDSKNITLTGGHGVTVGKSINLREGDNFYQGIVIVVNVNVITLDSPLDRIFTTDTYVVIGDINLKVDGSSTPVIAKIKPSPSEIWDITRMMYTIEDDTAMDTARFGGISALTYGIVIRSKRNSIFKNIYNVKSNGDFAERAYDISYDGKAPAGLFGFRCRRTFSGEEKNGTVVRLDGSTSDELQVIIQDNLTALTTFNIVVQGHVFSD